MPEKRVLVSCPLIQGTIGEYELFAEHGVTCDVPDVDQRLSEAQLLDRIDSYHGVLAGDDEFTARVFAAADNLEVVSKWGVGTDDIDAEAAAEHGVAVYNTPGAFDHEVADVVTAYAITLARDLHGIDRAVRNGEWHTPRGTSLQGKTFGVVGVGDIGSTVARRAHALGMNVVGHDVVEFPEELVSDTGIESVGKDELFERADVVSLNCALNDATRGMVGTDELERLGPEGYLINCARGGLVDQPALVAALESGTVAGAALDVYASEPLPESSALTGMENVVLGTHNAQNTAEAVSRVNDRAVENLLEGLGVVQPAR
jgi:D-3-phosphoglycerate dehydrogenase